MKQQLPPADLGRKARRTRAERAAERLEALAPWQLQIELVRHSMSGLQTEDFLPKNRAAEKLVGLSFVGRTPDEAAILDFWHFLEERGLGRKILEIVNARLCEARTGALQRPNCRRGLHQGAGFREKPHARPTAGILKGQAERKEAHGISA